MVKKLSYKRISTLDNGNVQFHNKEKSKLNSIINGNSDAYTLTHIKILKSPFNKNNVVTTKNK